ncbi:transmembrane amino acid transporter protein-domain-containing protein [Spinellus fusiger]|nr:transmembrane amino acid transporter protein-domain-containing protein [Spinellus fusiger]
MQTIDLPVEHAAAVVKRHLVTVKGQMRAHHRLLGGSVTDDLYVWVATTERHHQYRRCRAQSIPLPVVHPQQTLQVSLKAPGGFRRAFVLNKMKVEGQSMPKFLTSNFVEFLCLFGHFGGEDLSDSDSSHSDSSRSLSPGENNRDYEEEEEEEEDVKVQREDRLAPVSLSSKAAEQVASATTSRSSANSTVHGQSHLSERNTPSTSQSAGRYGNIQENHSVRSLSSLSTSHLSIPHYPRRLRLQERAPLLPKVRTHNSTGPQGKATPGKAMFLLLKSFVTTGIMFLPKAFSNGGIMFSVIGLCTLALVSLWSFLLLFQTRQVVPASFADMGGVLIGDRMRTSVLVAITLSQVGFVCAYMVFVAENIQSLMLTYSSCRLFIPTHLLILAQCFAFIPLAMIRRIQRLSVFAMIGDIFIVIGLGYLFFYDFKELHVSGMANVHLVWNPLHFPLFIGTAVFTFEGVGLVIPIIESMKEPDKFPRVLRHTLMLITLLFVSMGTLSYLAFGSHVHTIILLNLPSNDPMVASIQMLYSLAICLSIPLQLFPAIRIMENVLFTTRSGKNNAMVKWQKNVFRVLVVFLCAWIAVLGSKDKLDKFVSLVGALFCVPLCFVFPPLFHLKTFELSLWRRIANYLLIGLGCVCMGYISWVTLFQWNSGEVYDPVKYCVTHQV